MLRWPAILIMACMIVLEACGGSSSAPTSDTGSAVNACKLATAADVKAAFGGTVGDGVPGKTPDYCTFKLSGTLTSGFTIGVLGGEVVVSWNSRPVTKDSVVFKAATDPVPALGVAYYLKEGKALFVAAKGGALTYQAIVGDPNDDFIRGALIQLATSTYQRG